jgi:hypothetical protein
LPQSDPLRRLPLRPPPAAVEAATPPRSWARTPARPSTRSREKGPSSSTRTEGVLDLLAGIAVNALGYRHPRLVKAMKEEASGVWHVSNLFYMPAQGLLAERLLRASGMWRVFFCNTGTEATEAALKFARVKNPGRSRLVALDGSFHGRTFGALSVTGYEPYRTPFEPLLPGVVFVPPNDVEPSRAVGPTPRRSFSSRSSGGGIVRSPRSSASPAASPTPRHRARFDDQEQPRRTSHLFVFREVGVTRTRCPRRRSAAASPRRRPPRPVDGGTVAWHARNGVRGNPRLPARPQILDVSNGLLRRCRSSGPGSDGPRES